MSFTCTTSRFPNYLISFLASIFMVVPVSGIDNTPTLRTSTGELSREGHLRLEWEQPGVPAGEAVFEVQQAGQEDFAQVRTIYKGPDLATFVSGLKNGTYYYRVRQEGREWSNVVSVKVEHHSLRLTFILLSLGAVVFLLTAGIVIKGALQSA